MPLGVTCQVVDELVEFGARLGGTDIGEGCDAADGRLLRILLWTSREVLARTISAYPGVSGPYLALQVLLSVIFRGNHWLCDVLDALD